VNCMKVLIVDGLHDSDRGGAGIVAGLIDTLRSLADEAGTPLTLGLAFRYSADDPKFATAARHTAAAYPDVAIHANPLRTSSRHTGLGKKLDFLGVFLGACARLALPGLARDPITPAMREADVVISKGGHFYQSHETRFLPGLIHALLTTYCLLLAARLGRPYALVAQSYGPFRNAPSRWFARFVFRRAGLLSAREEISREVIGRLGIDTGRVEIIPDTAFALSPAPAAEVDAFLAGRGLADRRYAVVTARFWDFPDADPGQAEALYEAFLDAMAEAADGLLERGTVERVLLMVHNDGLHLDFEDDAKPVGAIHARMRCAERAEVVGEDLSPFLQAGLYGRAEVTIGTRMHSVIFALVAGGRAVAIAYNHKTTGIMGMLGLDRYVMAIDAMDGAKLSDLAAEAAGEREALAPVIAEGVGRLRAMIREGLGQALALGRGG